MAIIPELAAVGKPRRLLKCQPIVNHPPRPYPNGTFPVIQVGFYKLLTTAHFPIVAGSFACLAAGCMLRGFQVFHARRQPAFAFSASPLGRENRKGANGLMDNS